MRVPAKLAASAAILALVFAGAYAVGVVVGPPPSPAAEPAGGHGAMAGGGHGAAITAFGVEHDQRMHLIVVRRDTSGFQHLHPRMDPDGTWRVPLSVAAGGAYRVFADFTPAGGPAATLGVDLLAAGALRPRRPSALPQRQGRRLPGRPGRRPGPRSGLAPDPQAAQGRPAHHPGARP